LNVKNAFTSPVDSSAGSLLYRSLSNNDVDGYPISRFVSVTPCIEEQDQGGSFYRIYPFPFNMINRRINSYKICNFLKLLLIVFALEINQKV